ncbi:MAG: hypothetical protein A2010_15820 [Nitrospirae bacterium GWD2_57_9]|nr:MAG: hypothetical protein A2010_15820 [Nitrospirae bacterium GWD2_57_9]
MKCRTTKLLSPYLDGQLSSRERSAFESHLKECAFCRARLEAYGSLRERFAKADRHPAPAWFSAKVAARTSGSRLSRPSLFPVLVRFAEVLIVLLVIAVGVISGGFLVNGMQGRQMASFASSLSLDVFEPTPPDSVGGVYLAMTEANDED